MFGGLFARRVYVLLVALLAAAVLVTTDIATAEAQAGGGGCIDELEVQVTSEDASIFGFVTIPPGATFSTLIKHRISGTNSNGFNSEIRLSPARSDGFPGHDVAYRGFAADGPWANSEMDDGSFAWTNPADATQLDFVLEVGYWNRPFEQTGWTTAHNFLVTPVGDPGVPACVGAYTPPDVPATICDAWPTLFSNGGAVESAPFEMPADGWFGFNSIDTFPRREYEGGDKWPYLRNDWIAQVELWALNAAGVWELEDDQGTITENNWVRDAYVSSWSNLRNRSGSTTVKIRMYERFGPGIPATSTLLNVSTAPNGQPYVPFCPGDPVADTEVEFGAQGCAVDGANRGTFEYAVTNNSATSHNYKLIAGPHGHDPLVVGAGETVTFTLEGIPDGIHDVSVEVDGEVVDTLASVEFDCAQLESSVTVGVPGCAADAADGATLSFTVTNGDLVTQSFRLIVGPHGHFPLVVGPNQTVTFVLQGIPLGTWPVSVEYEDGTVVGSTDGLVFECTADRPTSLQLRYETGATDGLGRRMQATWAGPGVAEVRWFYDMTSAEIQAGNYESFVNQQIVSGNGDAIIPAEPGNDRNLWCVVVRGVWGDDTSRWTGPRCARSVKCIDQLASVMIERGENPTSGDDVIWATNGRDLLDAGAGDDLICARGGPDEIAGGPDNDTVYAGSGEDVVTGGEGDDTIFGGGEDDALSGEGGNDILDGGRGSDALFGGDNDDELKGGNGKDELYGGEGDDTLRGGSLVDLLSGGPGADKLYGDGGGDFLEGGENDDLLIGGGGNDKVHGGSGSDFADGEAGSNACRSVETYSNCVDSPAQCDVTPVLSNLASQVVADVLANGMSGSSVDSANLVSGCNTIPSDGIQVYGSSVFADGIGELVAEAEQEVTLQFLNVVPEWDVALEIKDGLKEAAAKLPPGRRLTVRMIVSNGEKPLSPDVLHSPPTPATLETHWGDLFTDDDNIVFELSHHSGPIFGNWHHDKVVTVDSRTTYITGANPQAEQSANGVGWYDIGVRIDGPHAQAALQNFDDAWLDSSSAWRCVLSFSNCAPINTEPIVRDYAAVVRVSGTTPVVALPRSDKELYPGGGISIDDTSNPQDRAWLSTLALAPSGSTVSIISPNLDDNNFEDAVEGAVARGVRVQILASYQFNDGLGDIPTLPDVGHNNCTAVRHLYDRTGGDLDAGLNPVNLEIRWHNDLQGNVAVGNGHRNASHAKFMGVRNRNGGTIYVIVGSGNQDTASWDLFHEYNVLIDRGPARRVFQTAFDPVWDAASGDNPVAAQCP